MKLFKKLIIFACSLTLVSCGYFGDDPVVDADLYKSEQLGNTCEIDVEGLSKILQEDVQKQISCLEENLITFSKYVKRADQNFVTDSELKSFVRRFFKGHADIITGSMTLIFEINSLFLKDSKNSISAENITPLFNLLKITNKEVSQIVQTLQKLDRDEITIEEGRRVLEKGLKSFSVQVKQIITQAGRGSETYINLTDFYNQAKAQFSNLNVEPVLFNAILSFKKLVLGGRRDVLTRDELFLILDSLPELASAAYTIIYTIESEEDLLSAQYETYLSQVDTLIENLYHHRREEEIFKVGEIEELVERFFNKNAEAYKGLLREYKGRILLNKNENIGFTYKDVRNTLSLGRILLKGMTFYSQIKDILPQDNSVSRENWDILQGTVKDLFLSLREGIKDEINENVYFPERMEFVDFTEFINSEFDDVSLPEFLVDGLPVAKVALVGGEKRSLKKLEVLNILDRSSDIADIFFDFNYANEDNHSKQEMSGLYYKNIKKAKFLLTGQQYLHVATIDELINLASKVVNDDYNVINYLEPIEALKEKIIGGYPSSMTVADLAKFLDLAQGYFSRNYFFDISFEVNEDILRQNRRITNLRYKHHHKFSEFEAEEVISLKKEFESIIKTYRLFRNEKGNVYIGDLYKRTKKGVLEIHLIQYFFNLVTKGFGHIDPDNGLYALNIDQINELQYLIKPILQDIGMWSVKPENFARNIILLADLFQGRSNGNLSLDVHEAAEYGALALFAIQTADKFVKEVKDKTCEWFEYEEDENGEKRMVEGFRLECYRTVYFDTLFNKLGLKAELPKLVKYIESASEDEALNYVTSVEGFARESRDPNRPQTQKDLVLLIGAMMNIESTYLRYDKDKSNYIEPRELDKAFPVYEEAIMMLANLSEGRRSYAETIFKYMIKNMSLPTPVQVGVYHFNPFQSKSVGSKRLNIGSLLYNLIIAADDSAKDNVVESTQEGAK